MENSTESTASSSIIALKYGFIYGLLSFLFSTLVNVMGWAEDFQESIGWISGIWSLVLTVTISVLCLREYREQNGGYISYGQGLGLTALLHFAIFVRKPSEKLKPTYSWLLDQPCELRVLSFR